MKNTCIEKRKSNIALSQRLSTIASLVTPGNRLVDVGCDHGFLSIWLVQQGIVPSAIASDVRPGPLSRAEEHVRENGLQDKIETRLSDGLKAIRPGEGDTLVIAGMGGPLMERILSDSIEVRDTFKELILQPQSDIPHFRKYLLEEGLTIIDERIVEEEGKFYPMMKIKVKKQEEYTDTKNKNISNKQEEYTDTENKKTSNQEEEYTDAENKKISNREIDETKTSCTDIGEISNTEISCTDVEDQDSSGDIVCTSNKNLYAGVDSSADFTWTPAEIQYGRYLLKSHDPVMERYLAREKKILENILLQLESEAGGRALQRKQEVEEQLKMLEAIENR